MSGNPCLPDSRPDHEDPRTSDPPLLCQSHPGREVLPQTACPVLQHEPQAACVTNDLQKAAGLNNFFFKINLQTDPDRQQKLLRHSVHAIRLIGLPHHGHLLTSLQQEIADFSIVCHWLATFDFQAQ